MTPNGNKYYIYFVAIFITLYLAQITVLNRFIGTNSIYLTGGTFIYFGTPLISDVVAEVYGSKCVKQLIILGCACMLAFSFLITATLYTHGPIMWAQTNNAYSISLGTMLKSALIGAVTIFIGQSINAYLMLKWQKKLSSRFFLLRSVGSSIIGDSVTVTLASIGIFFDRIDTIKDLFFSNIVPEVLVMIGVSIACSIPAAYIVNWLYKAEGINKKNRGAKFNPFVD